MQPLKLTKSLELYEKALELIPWASQTGSKRPTEYAMGAFPIYIEKGKGAEVWDVDGNKYIDYILGLGPITLGYSYEPVDAAVKAQIDRGVVFGLMHPVEVSAAHEVVQTIPSAEQVRFFKTGAESTSAAVRVARAYTGRDVILHCGYHGWLDAVIASVRSNGVPQDFTNVLHSFAWQDIAAVKALLEQFKGQIAAILVNPVSYYQVNDSSFLAELRELCDANGALLLYDEIVTGYRLAHGGAQEYFGVLPDLSCFAKGIANGYPVAALCGRREVMQTMNETIISSTYGGEAASLAALVASHEEYRKHDVPAVLARQGRRLVDGLNGAAAQVGVRARWFGYAPMSAYAFEYDDSELNRLCMTFWLQECAKRGVLFRRGGLNFLTLSHNDAIIDATIAIGLEVLGELKKAVDTGKTEELLETITAVRGRYEP